MNLFLKLTLPSLFAASVGFAQIPIITSGPQSPANPIPATYSAPTLSVTALNAVSYQWLKDGEPISGAVNASLAFPALRSSDAGDYTVRVTNAFGSVTSSPSAKIRVTAPHVVAPVFFSLNRGVADYFDFADDGADTYISLPGAHGVTRIRGGSGTIVFGGAQGSANGVGTAARFSAPTGLALDRVAEVLYVADTGNHAIRRVALSTAEVGSVAGRVGFFGLVDGTGNTAVFNHPTALVLKNDGTLYVADTSNHAIRAINTATSTVTVLAGGNANQPGSVNGVGTAARFRFPYGIALDATESNLYVADAGNHVIRKIDLATRAVTTVAGRAEQSGFLDGAASTALFFQPQGVTVDGLTGDILVADTGNDVLRKISASGTVSLLAGVFGPEFSIAPDRFGIGAQAFFESPLAIHWSTFKGVVYFSNRSNSAGSGRVSIALPANPEIHAHPTSRTLAQGASASLQMEWLGDESVVLYQWGRDGVALTDSGAITGSTQATLTLNGMQPNHAGLYTGGVANPYGAMLSDPAIVGLSSAGKVIGSGTEVGFNIFVAANGNTFDQVLLQGAAASITADPGQITRISYLDPDDDLVQVELGGAGTLSLVLDEVTGPVAPAKYNQAVTYMKGRAGIVITGANETTNITIFSVGRSTAVNQALFRNDVAYDGRASVAYVAILSSNGKFGGLRAANTNFSAAHGWTGVYAPGVAFTGPLFVGNINATGDARPVLVTASTVDARITGGDLLQGNGAAVHVAGIAQLKFTGGGDSHGNLLPAKTNRAVLQQGGADVTSQIVVHPTP